MGFGDVKLIGATSLILGFPAAIAGLLFAFWSGGIIGVLLLLTGKKHLHQHIPFGPFILLGSALACLPQARLFFLFPLTL
jgi:leader peptidase (prepilin peptidase)/N-methyltransferase